MEISNELKIINDKLIKDLNKIALNNIEYWYTENLRN